MTGIFYLMAIVCLAIVGIAWKKPEMLVHLEAVNKKFAGISRGKTIGIFLPAFFIFVILGGAFSDKKTVEGDAKTSEPKTGKESSRRFSSEPIEDNLSKFKKEFADKKYYSAYHLSAKLTETEKKYLLNSDMSLVKEEYEKEQKLFKEKYKSELEAISGEMKKKNYEEANGLCKKILETDSQFDEVLKILSDNLKVAYKIDIAQINTLYTKGSYQEALALSEQILAKEPKFLEANQLKEKASDMLAYFKMSNRQLKDKLEIKTCACNSYIENEKSDLGNKSLDKLMGEVNSLVENKLNCKLTIYNPTPISFKPETSVIVQFLSSTDAEIKTHILNVKENLKPFQTVPWNERDILDPREADEIKRTSKTLCVIDDVEKDVK